MTSLSGTCAITCNLKDQHVKLKIAELLEKEYENDNTDEIEELARYQEIRKAIKVQKAEEFISN